MKYMFMRSRTGTYQIPFDEYKLIHITLADLAAKYLWNAKRELSGEAVSRASMRRLRAGFPKSEI